MSDMLEFLVIEKLKRLGKEFYQASNGIRLVMGADEETLWYSHPGFELPTISNREVNAAMVEFLS